MKNTSIIFWAGLLAVLGVAGTGVGEFLLLFNPEGGYNFENYDYLAGRSREQIDLGHFLSVFLAPAYFLGYWHVMKNLRPKGKYTSKIFFGLAIYLFSLAGMWLSSRSSLDLGILAKQGQDPVTQSVVNALVLDIAGHADVLLQTAWVFLFSLSILFFVLVIKGRSVYPKWFAFCNPITILILVFTTYALAPAVGVYILPTAMNVVHVLFFGISTVLVGRNK